MTNSTPSLPPGFRFHPTDEELILHYLRNHAASSPCPVSIIAEVDIYKSDPWDLPKKAMYGDREWYFFSPRDRKYPNGVRPNRSAGSGYWKATGTDKPIVAASKGNESIGVKKALVFYKGKPPKGIKTNWIMHEYRLAESQATKNKTSRPMKLKDSSSMRLDDWVLCRIYQKSNHVQEEYSAGPETELPNMPESPQESKLYLPKSASMTDLFKEADFSLLSRLLEAPIETPTTTAVTEHDVSFGYTTNWNLQQPFYNMNQVPEADQYSSVSSTENGVSKRQRVLWEDGGSMFHPSKKSTSTSLACNKFSSQFDSQAFFNQQLLLKTHLGMQ